MITFPASALENEGEDGSKAVPSVGDTVTLPNVVGVVKSADGDNISVDIQTVNDQPASYGEAPEEPGESDMHGKMEKLAAEADKE